MRELKTWAAVLGTLAGLIVLPGFGSHQTGMNAVEMGGASVAHYIAVLKSGTPQQKAAAAYWLGQQHGSAAEAVSMLADLLGDRSEVDAFRYRQASRDKRTLGEEAAAAMVQIGHASIAPLIRVLKGSPSAEARKNAAWALGQLHENTADGSSTS